MRQIPKININNPVTLLYQMENDRMWVVEEGYYQQEGVSDGDNVDEYLSGNEPYAFFSEIAKAMTASGASLYAESCFLHNGKEAGIVSAMRTKGFLMKKVAML